MYEPREIESKWDTYWREHVSFIPHPESHSVFTMVYIITENNE